MAQSGRYQGEMNDEFWKLYYSNDFKKSFTNIVPFNQDFGYCHYSSKNLQLLLEENEQRLRRMKTPKAVRDVKCRSVLLKRRIKQAIWIEDRLQLNLHWSCAHSRKLREPSQKHLLSSRKSLAAAMKAALVD